MRSAYPILQTDAFILHTSAVGEADRRITLLTARDGVLEARGRSIRREGAKMRSAALPYRRVRLSLVFGRTCILKDIRVTDPLCGIWSDTHRYSAFVRLLRHIYDLVPAVQEQDRHLFPITEEATHALAEASPEETDTALLTAQVMVLDTLGLGGGTPQQSFSDTLRTMSRSAEDRRHAAERLRTALLHN